MAGKAQMVVAGVSRWITPLVVVVAVIALLVFAKKVLSSFRARNIGRTGGSDDFSNLANDVYLLDGWFVDPNTIDEVCGRVLALDDDGIGRVYDKFKTLFGAKCPGGGVMCDDTTTMKVFLIEQSCAVAGCAKKDALVRKLSEMGL